MTKQRIINKKLKKDILFNLWIKQWRHTLDIMNNIMPCLTVEEYNNHESIMYCRFKIGQWMMNYEFIKVLKVGQKNHNIKIKNVYDYLLKNNMAAFKYNYYKKFFLEYIK